MSLNHEFNIRIAHRILADLESAESNAISMDLLEDSLNKNLIAIDSTFPDNIRAEIDGILSKIQYHKERQYAATLNTPAEGSRDETLPLRGLFSEEVKLIKLFLTGKKKKKKILNIDVFEKLKDGRLLARGSNPEFSTYSINEAKSSFIGEKFLKDDCGYIQKVQIVDCYVMQVMWRDQLYDVEFESLKLDEIPPNVLLYEAIKDDT